MADWVRGAGSWIYGRNITKAEACTKAEDLAKQHAIRQVAGETIKGEDHVNCSEHNNKTQCELNQFTWTILEGYVMAIKDKREMDRPRKGDYRKCTVILSANIVVPKIRHDAAFDVRAKMDKASYLDESPFFLEVETTHPAHLQVFQWLPYSYNDENVMQIFPRLGNTQVDLEKIGKGKFQLPNTSKGNYYRAEFSKHLKGKKNIEDNYLIVIATKKPVEFLSRYTRDSFAEKLHRMDADSYRVVKLQYNIVSK